MVLAATVIWCGTAVFGLYLLGVWLSHGGLRQQATRITVFPAALIFAHPVLATGGLSLWLAFLGTRRIVYAWSGFGVLACSAMLGFVMLTRWLVGRGGRHARGAEQHFPARVVAMHGTVGLTTFALVLIAATEATAH
jgi:energy-converting hydrogenase Eha subunit A